MVGWAGPERAGLRAQNVKPNLTLRKWPDWAYLDRVRSDQSAGYMTKQRATSLDVAHFDNFILRYSSCVEI
ncbi:hypothetical protein PanWU01x14_102660 [Parasponia andersonii]|uniref:Uncharacterized protein n=1 Tax=Parasponia andersonii TaxID=3476 RepID=A0A2P5D2E3_PARAD|nr:hypothetical protein PanWU01x14_102660 [Parasponia andersonii]